LLIFGTGGLAYGRTQTSSRLIMAPFGQDILLFPGLDSIVCQSIPVNSAPNICLAGSNSNASIAWTVGGGFEWMLRNKVPLIVEYLGVDLTDTTFKMVVKGPNAGPGSATATFHNNYNVVRAGMNFQF